MAEDSVDS